MKRLGGWLKKNRRLIPFAFLAIFVILPLLWIGLCLTIRSGIYLPWGNTSKNTPDPNLMRMFLIFIGGGLATAVTLIASLLTYDHNRLERERLREHSQEEERRLMLDLAIRDLELMSINKQAKIAGALANMVELGHTDMALRTLEPIWHTKQVDAGTATWLIDQVLEKEEKNGNKQSPAINEAITLLKVHAASLTDSKRHMWGWPPHLYHWDPELSEYAKREILMAATLLITSQSKSWWQFGEHNDLRAPVRLLSEATADKDIHISAAASNILDSLAACCPEAVPLRNHLAADSSDVPTWAAAMSRLIKAWAAKGANSRSHQNSRSHHRPTFDPTTAPVRTGDDR